MTVNVRKAMQDVRKKAFWHAWRHQKASQWLQDDARKP